MNASHPKPVAATHALRFPQLEREVASREDETLYQSARRHGVRIVGACGGRGTCGSCMVRLHHGDVVSQQVDPCLGTDSLHGHAPAEDGRPAHRKPWVRACQVSARADCTLEIAPRSMAPVVRAEAEQGEREMLPLDAAVVAFELDLPEATLADNLSDVDRVLRALDAGALQVDPVAVRTLPQALRAHAHGGHWPLQVWQRGTELIGFGPPGSRTLGLAVDLGTTNAAAFLIDLSNGERLASLGLENPQVAWGADLISRINHAIKDDAALQALQQAAVEAINALAHDLCRSVGCQPQDIFDVALCGNTAMHHLLMGLPVRQLGRAPFVAALRHPVDLKARELGLHTAPGAWLHAVPNVGGFVGGDHVTALVATEPVWRSATTSLVMDIGTNTEISVIHDGRLHTASAPSGPALEGGHISCGMRAAEGAIERVRLVDGRIAVQTIAHKRAVGLCGSGVLDTLAVMHRGGLVNAQGRLVADHPDIVHLPSRRGERRALRLAEDVYFTQDDVRAVQLAKAAIRTATELLLDEAGVRAEQIEHFLIAGSFGAYINVDSGIEVGLFPTLPRPRFQQVGNAAGAGVRQLLASRRARERAAELAAQCRFIELSARADFQKTFLHHIGFPKTPQPQHP